jgi:hypothetical protein
VALTTAAVEVTIRSAPTIAEDSATVGGVLPASTVGDTPPIGAAGVGVGGTSVKGAGDWTGISPSSMCSSGV